MCHVGRGVLDPIEAFEAWERVGRRQLGEPPAYIEGCFDFQRAVISDSEPLKALLTPRRAGKTETGIRWLAEGMERWGGNDTWSGYINPTRVQSREIIEGPLRALIKEYNLPFEFSSPDGQIHLTNTDNGHTLWIGGADTLTKADRLRGKKWRRFFIDEGGTWDSEILSYVIDDVLDAGLTDYGGELLLAGTPGLLPKGLFYEVTTEGEFLPDGRDKRAMWPTHKWSILDNPHHPWGPGPYDRWSDPNSPDYNPRIITGAAGLEAHRLSKGWNKDDPTYRREYLGEWASDPELLIYSPRAVNLLGSDRSDPSLGFYPECLDSLIDKYRNYKIHWVLGIDVGEREDRTAFALTASIVGLPYIYVLRTWGDGKYSMPERSREAMQVLDTLRKRQQHCRIVIDTGGGGSLVAADMARYGVHAEAAKKTEKVANIQLVQGALLSGNLRINAIESTSLLDEWAILRWNDQRTNHDKTTPDHKADALLYALRRHPIFERWEETEPEVGTNEYYDKKVAQERERRSRMVARRKNRTNPFKSRRYA